MDYQLNVNQFWSIIKGDEMREEQTDNHNKKSILFLCSNVKANNV